MIVFYVQHRIPHVMSVYFLCLYTRYYENRWVVIAYSFMGSVLNETYMTNNKYTLECSPIFAEKYFLRNKFRGGINLSIHEMGVRPTIYQITLCHNPFVVMYFILPVWFIDFIQTVCILRRKGIIKKRI